MANYNYQADGSKYDHLIENGSDFEIGDIIGKGWDLFQRDWLNILGFTFTIGLLVILGMIIPILGWLALFIYLPVLSASTILLLSKIQKGEEYTYRGIFEECSSSLRELWIAGFLMSIMIMIGLCFFLLPGIYLAIAYQFTIPLIIFGKLDAWTAMETSRKIITKNFGRFLLFMIAIYFVTILCSLIPIAGAFIATGLAMASQYALFSEVTGATDEYLESKIENIGVTPDDAWK